MKKSFRYVWLTCALVVMSALAVFIYLRGPSIYRDIIEWRVKRAAEKEYARLHSNDDIIGGFISLQDDPNAWYMNYHVICHGCGGIGGVMNTNSVEALDSHYDNGSRLFDVDFNWTSDSVLVLHHSWRDHFDNKPTPHFESERIYMNNIHQDYYFVNEALSSPMNYENFSKMLLCNKYHTLSVEGLLNWLESHPDAIIFPDLKKDMERQIETLFKLSQDKNQRDILKRIVFRVNNQEQLYKIKEICPTAQIMYRQYTITDKSYADVLSFCINNDIHNVCFAFEKGNDTIMKSFESKGVHVWLGVIDYYSDYRWFKDNINISRVVSNWLNEDDLN